MTARHAAPKNRARRILVTTGAVAGALILPTGIAQAYITATGSGSGSADSGSLASLTASATPGTALVPGGSSSLVLTVSNPSALPQQVTSVANVSAITTDGGADGTCTTSNSQVAFATPSSGLPFTVPAGGQITVTLANAVSMGTTAASGCQGATFTVPLTLSGRNS